MGHVWNTEAKERTRKTRKGHGLPSALSASFRAFRVPDVLRLILLGLLAAACAAPGAPPPTLSPTTEPTATRAPIPVVPRPPAALATPALSPVSGPLVPPEQTAAVDAAKRDLAQRIGVPLADIKMASAAAMDWPDTALGCPKPGMFYGQVVTPGYRIVLSAKGQQYEYHSDRKGTVVYCEEP